MLSTGSVRLRKPWRVAPVTERRTVAWHRIASRTLLALLLMFAVGAADGIESRFALENDSKPARGKRSDRLLRLAHPVATSCRPQWAAAEVAVPHWTPDGPSVHDPQREWAVAPPLHVGSNGSVWSHRHCVPTYDRRGSRYLPNPPPLLV